jgi:alpha-L-fucosidase
MLSLFAILPTKSPAAEIKSTETAAQRDARMQWWRDARFGMFIHFGLYAIPGRGEWVQWNEQIPVDEYAKLAQQFKPDFKPDEWAATAKAAGMKYMVLTARHHDGFALFDDGTNTFTTTKTAAHRDFVAEYVKAVRAAGLHVGLYYSPLDWRFPGYVLPDLQLSSAEAMREQYHRQMKELLSNYGKIDVLWFDGGETDWLDFGSDWLSGGQRQKRPAGKHYQGRFDWQHDQVYTMLRELQPQVIINGRADMPEDFHSREGDGALGNFDADKPWELCTTLAGAWGYEPNKTPKSLKSCVQLLAKVAGHDGNLLLNVGPRPDGQIDPPQAQRLREIGEWLNTHGESIYATRGGPFLPGDYGASTHHENKIYVHVLKWPGDQLVLPNIPAKVLHASVWGGGAASFAQSKNAIELSVTADQRNDMDTVIVLELNQPAASVKPVAADRE